MDANDAERDPTRPGGGPDDHLGGEDFGEGLDGERDVGFGITQGVRVYARDELREIDRLCVTEFGLPSLALMEHAAAQLTEAVVRLLSILGGAEALVVCGRGNNGGDGLAAARHLDALGFDAGVILAGSGDGLSGDAGTQLAICRAAEIPVVELDEADGEEQVESAISALLGRSAFDGPGALVVVDALFGTGLSRAPEGVSRALVGWMNAVAAAGATVVSADVPSGLEADTGRAFEPCVKADLTVTFAGLKRGFLELSAQPYLGEVVVAPIGAPGVLLERFGEAVEPDWAERFARDDGFEDVAPGEAPSDGARGAAGPPGGGAR